MFISTSSNRANWLNRKTAKRGLYGKVWNNQCYFVEAQSTNYTCNSDCLPVIRPGKLPIAGISVTQSGSWLLSPFRTRAYDIVEQQLENNREESSGHEVIENYRYGIKHMTDAYKWGIGHTINSTNSIKVQSPISDITKIRSY